MTTSPAPETAPIAALPVDALPGQPWPEPWRPDRSSRPSTQYWDVETACWHCDGARGEGATGSALAPRPGD